MSLANMSLSMSLGRDERIWKMENEIMSGRALTVSACARAVEVSQSTIRSYLKEANMAIYDDENKDMTKIYNKDTKVFYPF